MPQARRSIALDGKTLRRSFDNFNDRKAAQLLHAFDVDVDAGLVLAHVDIEEKSNEIPAAQQLLGELQVAHCGRQMTRSSAGIFLVYTGASTAPLPKSGAM